MKPFIPIHRRIGFFSAAALVAPLAALAAVPGITGPTFNLVANAAYVSQPDGASIYAWGYGCDGAASGFMPAKGPGAGPDARCPDMQMPGPTMIVRVGDAVTVNLRNGLPLAAGNTSIVFTGLQATATGGVAGLLGQEAANAGTDAPHSTVSYSFTATKPGTYAYHSGTQASLQVEMGLFGAVIVLPPANSNNTKNCTKGQFSLAAAAYDNPNTCYDREYMFQLSEMDSRLHDAAFAQVQACTAPPCPAIRVATEPYHPNYFVINGRSMPDLMDTPYAAGYPRQPYNGNPHMKPGEKVLMRIIGQGRWQHPFHFHGNHARVLARDGNLIVSQSDGVSLAGPLLFTTPTVPGQTQDQIFTWTGKGLNWDVYNHSDPAIPCTPDASGYHSVVTDPNYGEWCADHLKPIPITPPDPTIVALGQWYSGTPYLGVQNTGKFTGTNEPPGTLNQNPTSGYAYMWHSHNEREITTNDVFPGGMLTMLIIDPPLTFVDETK